MGPGIRMWTSLEGERHPLQCQNHTVSSEGRREEERRSHASAHVCPIPCFPLATTHLCTSGLAPWLFLGKPGACITAWISSKLRTGWIIFGGLDSMRDKDWSPTFQLNFWAALHLQTGNVHLTRRSFREEGISQNNQTSCRVILCPTCLQSPRM